MNAIATISAATRYAFTQDGGVALNGKLGYVFVHNNGQISFEKEICFGDVTYGEYFPAYHTSEIVTAQMEAARLLKVK